MKLLSLGVLVFVFALVISSGEITFAQSPQGNVVVINNAEGIADFMRQLSGV